MCMMVVMLPFFLFAMYEKHGQPLEKILGNIIRVSVIRPKERPYRTNNFYAVLERQANLDEEVSHIVYGNQTLATPAVRKKTRNKLCSRSKQKKSCPAPIKSRSRLRLPVQTARTKRKNRAQDSIPYERMWPDGNLPCGRRPLHKNHPIPGHQLPALADEDKTAISRAGVTFSTTLTARFALSCLF